MNDDGVQFRGLWHLVKALAPEHQVTVVAPDREQSGVGTAISLHRILRVRPVQPEVPGVPAYAVEGTPGDCVILGLGALCTDAELVIAGINEGANLGDDVFISGTVGAALQARFRGLPAMAVSVSDLGSEHYGTAASVAARLVRALAAGDLPADTLLNVNVPDLPATEIRGVMVTRQARRSTATWCGRRPMPAARSTTGWCAGTPSGRWRKARTSGPSSTGTCRSSRCRPTSGASARSRPCRLSAGRCWTNCGRESFP